MLSERCFDLKEYQQDLEYLDQRYERLLKRNAQMYFNDTYVQHRGTKKLLFELLLLVGLPKAAAEQMREYMSIEDIEI